MKILIATGIFPPDVGGPAKYAQNLKGEFSKRGFETKVVAYGLEKKLPIFIRHIFYFLKVILNIPKTDLIIALDIFSTGFPAVLAARIFGKKIILRIGGDFLWETYIEKTGNLITLKNFYAKKPALALKHRIIAALQNFTLKNASALAFNSIWQKELFEKIYNLKPEKNFVVENFYGEKTGGLEPKNKNFLFAGRNIKFKNLAFLQDIFKELKKEGSEAELEIADNLAPNKLEEKIKNCYCLIVPSITDFAPNIIMEGISADKPFILTKECGLADKLADIGIFISPFNKWEIKNKILFLLKKENYEMMKAKISEFKFTHSWQEVADEFLGIYKQL